MSQFSSPEELEKAHVRDVYDQIAPRFASVQSKAWPKVTEFLLSLPGGSLIADVGCGSGKYLGLAPGSYMTGSDTCAQFVTIAREKQHEVCVSDNQRLPYRDGCFDAVISVGVIHHFASPKRRLRALQELARILRPGGRMLVYAWAVEQSERKFDGQDVLVPYKGCQKSKGRRRYHACHFAAKDTNGQEQEGAHDKCLCSVIFHESLFEDKAQPRRRTVHSRSANSQNLLVGKDCRVSQQNQAKTASNGHGQTYPPKNDVVTKEGKASKSTVSNFVSLVVEKLFDNKEPSNQNSALERGSRSAGIQSKLRCLRPAQTHREDVHSKSFLTFVSSKMFRFNENTFCAATGDYEKESHKATDLKPGKPCTSTCDVTTRFAERTSLNRDCSYCACTSRDNEVEGESFAAKVEPSTRERTSGVGPRLLARLLETLSSSDTESDSSSSSDCLVSDSSVSDECEMPSVCGVPCCKKAFRHTTLCCQEFGVSSSSTDEFNPACNGSSDSTVQGSSFQRYYHVFHQGELVELIQGVPSVDVIEETYDHANWAVVAVKS